MLAQLSIIPKLLEIFGKRIMVDMQFQLLSGILVMEMTSDFLTHTLCTQSLKFFTYPFFVQKLSQCVN